MTAVVPEIIGDVGILPMRPGMCSVGVRHRLVVHGVHHIDRCLGIPVVGNDGVQGHGFVQLRHFFGLLLHCLGGQQFMRDLCADQLVDLRGGETFAVDPFVHMLAKEGFHHVR